MVVRSLVSAHCVVAAVSLSLQWGPAGAQHAPQPRFSSSPRVSLGGEAVSVEGVTTFGEPQLSSEPPLGLCQTPRGSASGIDPLELKMELERELDLKRGAGLEGMMSLEPNHNESLMTPMSSPLLNETRPEPVQSRPGGTRLDQVRYNDHGSLARLGSLAPSCNRRTTITTPPPHHLSRFYLRLVSGRRCFGREGRPSLGRAPPVSPPASAPPRSIAGRC